MENTNVTEKKQVNSILGFTVEHNENNSINVILNRNQVINFESGLNDLNEQLQQFDAPLQMFDAYVNNSLKKQLKQKGYVFNSFSVKDGSKTASSLTESQIAIKKQLIEFVENLDDSVKVAGKTYLPDKNGNYKEVSLTFTTRADKQQGLTAKENQTRIDNLINDTLKVVKSEEVETITKDDSEESFQL
tara:strand:+ start:219 stop:785 length:567 start_codon:yes stop_codon:yes gene_type:complete